MTLTETGFEGLTIIEPRVFEDERGYFMESFNQRSFEEATGIQQSFVQDNESVSSKGVLRGLHFQTPPMAQAKLIRVVRGAPRDVGAEMADVQAATVQEGGG